ncbi:uncharacterized protein LOC104441521 [Eucalyptus grandis]|uniref:uncharacterized protein LOC104441521 n=1 Tax=Eucalyptus grandis TaxID=71139 RepID=UPI00192E8E48|nr:uncharacterized protein LOC104441521 [Eucalyptus grandis]
MPHNVEQEPERVIDLDGRSLPPVHYEVEINPVSELLKLKTYKSGVFEAGGYEWSLCLYPKGDPDLKGNDPAYMSLSLLMEEPNKLGDDEKIVVDYKFFAFNYKSWTYVIFTEKGKELRAFSKARTKLGLPKFLSLKNFNDLNNGYCKDDHCIFGAEVMVSKSKRKMETLTIVKGPPQNTITCAIQQFSTSSKHPQYSKAFKVGGWEWKLKVFPRHNGAQQGKSLSVYLEAQGLRPRTKKYVEAILWVLNKKDTNNKKGKTVWGWLSDKKFDCGAKEFMPWKDLEKTDGGFVNKKELAFEVKILVISDVQRSDESVLMT